MLLIKEYLKLRGVSKITQFGPNAAAVALTGRATRADHTSEASDSLEASKQVLCSVAYSNSIIAVAAVMACWGPPHMMFWQPKLFLRCQGSGGVGSA